MGHMVDYCFFFLLFPLLQLDKAVFFLSETDVFHVIVKLKNALRGRDSFML